MKAFFYVSCQDSQGAKDPRSDKLFCWLVQYKVPVNHELFILTNVNINKNIAIPDPSTLKNG